MGRARDIARVGAALPHLTPAALAAVLAVIDAPDARRADPGLADD